MPLQVFNVTRDGKDTGDRSFPAPLPLSLKGPVTSFVPSWLRLPTELTLWPPRAEAKRLKSALRNVASVGLSVQQSTSSGREGYCTYKSLVVFT